MVQDWLFKSVHKVHRTTFEVFISLIIAWMKIGEWEKAFLFVEEAQEWVRSAEEESVLDFIKMLVCLEDPVKVQDLLNTLKGPEPFTLNN